MSRSSRTRRSSRRSFETSSSRTFLRPTPGNDRLTRADLTGADLSDARLTNANLSAAFLTDANLADANITGANLSGAYVTQEQLDSACISRNGKAPTLPDGLKPPHYVGAP